MDFETVTARSRTQRTTDAARTPTAEPHSPRAALRRMLEEHRPQAVVLALVILVLAGGALYASRLSEASPRVVYAFALEEAEADAGRSLLIDINAADAERLQELPGVGPATAGAIIEHRRLNGPFGSVDELDDVPGIGPATLAEIAPLATV